MRGADEHAARHKPDQRLLLATAAVKTAGAAVVSQFEFRLLTKSGHSVKLLEADTWSHQPRTFVRLNFSAIPL